MTHLLDSEDLISCYLQDKQCLLYSCAGVLANRKYHTVSSASAASDDPTTSIANPTISSETSAHEEDGNPFSGIISDQEDSSVESEDEADV